MHTTCTCISYTHAVSKGRGCVPLKWYKRSSSNVYLVILWPTLKLNILFTWRFWLAQNWDYKLIPEPCPFPIFLHFNISEKSPRCNTIGTSEIVLYMEVPLIQRLSNIVTIRSFTLFQPVYLPLFWPFCVGLCQGNVTENGQAGEEWNNIYILIWIANQ